MYMQKMQHGFSRKVQKMQHDFYQKVQKMQHDTLNSLKKPPKGGIFIIIAY